MAAFLKNFGKSAETPVSLDLDFGDFAGAPDATPGQSPSIAAPAAAATAPYTKWYNVHERHSLGEFKNEGYILLFLMAIMIVHVWGTRTNRAKAKAWMAAHREALQSEYSLVGFTAPRRLTAEQVEGEGLANLTQAPPPSSDELKERSPCEFSAYATGRQNVAFMDIKLTLHKRYNPFAMAFEQGAGFVLDSMPAPVEHAEAIAYAFDGKEALTIPGFDARKEKSTYDACVWAVVNKDVMRQLRDDRYDLSITATKDHSKLPAWATVMTESAEITDALLTPELIQAIETAGDAFQYLIVSDQPIDKPTTIAETEPKKRVYLSINFTNYDDTLPLFKYFLRLPDHLVQAAHFRPEVTRKLAAVRADAVKDLKKAEDKIRAEEREMERDKAKKMKRDLDLRGLDAKAQKKYLEKEREREQKKMAKKMTQKG